MRTFTVLLLACLFGILFSSAVLWRRHHNTRHLKAVALQVEQQSARHPADVQKPVSPLEPLLQGVNDYLWIESWYGKGSKTRTIPVDKSVTRLVVSATGEPHGCVLQAVDPSGHAVEPTRTKTRILELESGTVYAIDKPQPGTWQWIVTGEGHLSLWARAASKMGLDSLTLVNQQTNQPIEIDAGEEIPRETPLNATVRFSSQVTLRPQFFLITEDGTRLENRIQVTSMKTDRAAASNRREFVFELSLSAPESNFRFAVESKDLSGEVLQRVTEPLLHVVPQP